MPVLEVAHLHKSFSQHLRRGFFSSEKRAVLNDISFTLEQGETLGIIGESGSGKSTLGRCIAGLETADSGQIIFDGKNIDNDADRQRFVGTGIQLVFQAYSASLDPQLTIERIITEGRDTEKQTRTDRASLRTAEHLCTLVGLSSDILPRYPYQLSGGQRQRVAIARAIAVQPRVLILDEPTSALDVLTQAQILSLIKKLRREFSIGTIFISHNIANSMQLCDRIAVLHQGSIVEMDETREIRRRAKHPYTRTLLISSPE